MSSPNDQQTVASWCRQPHTLSHERSNVAWNNCALQPEHVYERNVAAGQVCSERVAGGKKTLSVALCGMQIPVAAPGGRHVRRSNKQSHGTLP